ncbi:MAG: hypothetical protein FWH29_02020 [Methanobrevibacter sp.]|nr:hypothetical protein [Methanobrevibacter sp.]
MVLLIDKFLKFYEYGILRNKGIVSRKQAVKITKEEYKNFREIHDKD